MRSRGSSSTRGERGRSRQQSTSRGARGPAPVLVDVAIQRQGAQRGARQGVLVLIVTCSWTFEFVVPCRAPTRPAKPFPAAPRGRNSTLYAVTRLESHTEPDS